MAKIKRPISIVLVLSFFLSGLAQIECNCMLSMRTDLTYNQPLILTKFTNEWYPLTNTPKGILQLTRDEWVKLVCPSAPAQPNSLRQFFGKSEMLAKCTNGNKFEVDKKVYSFDQLQCSTPVKATVYRTSTPCLGANTELVKVGYNTMEAFRSVYDVCFNKENLGTLYTEVVISPDIEKNDAPISEAAWVTDPSIYGPINLDSDYTCPKQALTFETILGKKYFEGNDKCCLERTQLVNPADLAFGPQQVATYHYLNTVPQWSTCNKVNWNEVEHRVRALTVRLRRPLTVWSGTFRSMRVRRNWSLFYSDMYVHYTDKNDKAAPVPLYIWKVVYDPQSQKALAIIEVNNPKLEITDIDSHVLCDDICDNVNWMSFLARKTISKGYVYCCDLNSFEFSFQFKQSPFPKASGGILRDETRLR